MKQTLSWRLRLLALSLLVLLTGPGASTVARPPVKPFDAGSLAAIREAQRGRPFLVAFWSLHCAPCKDDLALLTALHARYPQVAIFLVAADGPNEHAEVARYLAQFRLGRIEAWAFADDFAERIRYAVDPEWRGELPRAYFFDAGHRSTGHSGVLDAAELEAWLVRARPPKSASG